MNLYSITIIEYNYYYPGEKKKKKKVTKIS